MTRTRKLSSAAALLCGLLTSAVLAGGVATANQDNDPLTFKNVGDEQCLAVAPDNAVGTMDCAAEPNQVWVAERANDGVYMLKNPKSGLCLDAAEGAFVLVKECARTPEQLFRVQQAGGRNITVQSVAHEDGFVTATGPNSPVTLAPLNQEDSRQVWEGQPAR